MSISTCFVSNSILYILYFCDFQLFSYSLEYPNSYLLANFMTFYLKTVSYHFNLSFHMPYYDFSYHHFAFHLINLIY